MLIERTLLSSMGACSGMQLPVFSSHRAAYLGMYATAVYSIISSAVETQIVVPGCCLLTIFSLCSSIAPRGCCGVHLCLTA